MSDYASAAFVGLILRRMAAAGITLPSDLQVATTPGGPPLVTLDLKRRLLAHACAMAGPAFVIEVGQGIHAIPSDPTLDVLRRASDPAGLLDRWGRLEKYHHSHHRVEVLQVDEGGARLRHRSLRGPAPAALESLAVLGLLVALLQAIGCDGIEANLDDEPAMRQGRGVLTALPSGPVDWHLRWVSAQAGRRVPPPPPGLIEQLYALLDDDPVRPWPINQAAGAVGLSTRDLQRRLQRQGASWSGILRDARVRRAARAMLDTPTSLAEIGYAAGFADQAHFTREFRRILGASPAEWRRVAAPNRRP
ncbi:MAG: helix-turn-helix transcriptional regulator [Alphaproteobacteria bacterium]|nr:helix-turn-helix transcriptional regulator [Alphaproteobacteria bacterium]